ncbi:hypothetical protein [Reichenbachiella sp.]|uniref:hypothetical protein n=1 Tax=Reichenbachiella sp. TaxID=2184521 RepID=UPI0032987852
MSAQYDTKGLDLDGDLSAWYDEAVGYKNVPILEGSYYPLDYLALKKGPYFISSKWQQGHLKYSGETYDSVYLLYHVHKDVLIIRNIALQNVSIEPTLLNLDKVEAFTIQEHQFVHLKDSVLPSHGSGFYELYYDGQTINFYIKRVKNEYVRGEGIEFLNEDLYFLYDGEEYIRFKGVKSVYKRFPNIKSKLKAYKKPHFANFKRGEDSGMRKWLSYGDHLLTEK